MQTQEYQLLERTELFERRKKYKKHAMVYFLFFGDEIVYVGKSENGVARIYDHYIGDKKRFDSYAYVSCNFQELGDLEKLYIEKFKPRYNILIANGCGDIMERHQRVESLGNGKKSIRIPYSNRINHKAYKKYSHFDF
jgi:hypothetical protein